jgi:chorismate mutase
MRVVAVRGATQLTRDDSVEMAEAVTELLSTIFERNSIDKSDLISIFFTSTEDLISDFPAAAARKLDLGDIPLMCAREIPVKGSLPRVVRVMVYMHSELSHEQVKHIYARGAEVLRKDIAQ